MATNAILYCGLPPVGEVTVVLLGPTVVVVAPVYAAVVVAVGAEVVVAD